MHAKKTTATLCAPGPHCEPGQARALSSAALAKQTESSKRKTGGFTHIERDVKTAQLGRRIQSQEFSMTHSPFARAIAAIATPFRPDLSVDREALVAHASWLFDNGCDGLVLFGTTGEAVSLTVAERKSTLERLMESGIAADKIVVGTGCCAVADTVELTKHASDMGAAGALVLPPYFYKNVADEGLSAYYDGVIRECGGSSPPLYLYHIPQVAGAGVSLQLVQRLVDAHGDKIRGYKDSSGDWSHTASLLERFPALDIFVGSETLLLESLNAGGAGCISAGVNVQPARVRAVIEGWQSGNVAQLQSVASTVRAALEKSGPLIAAIKAVLAALHGRENWTVARPPLEPLPRAAATGLLAKLRDLQLEGL
jgi:4-hydroxy-tetrahydrodipicolinate synthase